MVTIHDRFANGKSMLGSPGQDHIVGTDANDFIAGDTLNGVDVIHVQSGRYSGFILNSTTLGYGLGEGHGYRGQLMLVFDPVTKQPLKWEWDPDLFRPLNKDEFQINIFDTWWRAPHREEYISEVLPAIPQGALVILATGDDGGYVHASFRADLVPILEGFGAKDVSKIGLRDSHIFAFVKGGEVIAEKFVQTGGFNWSFAEETIRVNLADFGASVSGFGHDILLGGLGNDALHGDGGNDTLEGGLGNDEIHGGPGSDTIIYGAQDGSDVIYDFDDGWDLIALHDGLTFNQLVINHEQEQVVITAPGSGNSITIKGDDLPLITGLDFIDDAGISYADTHHDLNGDGKDEVLLYNHLSGTLGSWSVSGSQKSYALVGQTNVSWAIVGAGDFDLDGFDDVLWRNSETGRVSSWLLDSSGGYQYKTLGRPDLNWNIEGIGDFNGDRTDDILWRHSNGTVALWEMKEASQTYNQLLKVGSDWDITGTGDFSGDGTEDVLWFNQSNGLYGAWIMDDGITFRTFSKPGTGWEFAGTGDFTGDGSDDILWFNESTGRLGNWDIDTDTFEYHAIGTAGIGWGVERTGDYSGDGVDDILFRSETGYVGFWEMSAEDYRYQALGPAGSAWSIVEADLEGI